MLHFYLAFLMQFGPPWLPPAEQLPPPRPVPASFALIRTACLAYGIAAEIIDQREAPWLFANPESFAADWRILTGRLEELRDAPRLFEAHRFPPRCVCCQMLALNRGYAEHLAAVSALYPRRDWRALRAETARRHEVYDCVRDASCDYYHAPVKRRALMRLREMLGDAAFYAGRVPEPIP